MGTIHLNQSTAVWKACGSIKICPCRPSPTPIATAATQKLEWQKRKSLQSDRYELMPVPFASKERTDEKADYPQQEDKIGTYPNSTGTHIKMQTP